MLRRSIPLLLLTVVLGYFVAQAWSGAPVDGPSVGAGQRVADLQDLLEKGLRARLPREFRFIRRVVRLVEQGKLPLPMVISTFEWARRQVVGRKYPFPYFERALRLRARRIGVTI